MNTRGTMTLRTLAAPLLSLRVLLSEFPDLPAPCVHVSETFPERLDLAFHDDLAAFETWREALGIDPGSVSCGVQGRGRTRVLKAEGDFAGALVCLTGFSPVPPAVVGGAA